MGFIKTQITTFTTLLFVIFFITTSFIAVNSQAYDGLEDINFSIKNKSLTVSYRLYDTADEFWEALEDTLKSGQKIDIIHHISIKPDGFRPWFAKLSDIKIHYVVGYNLLENIYTYSNGGAVTYVSKSPQAIKNYVLSVRNLPLIANEALQKGEPYKIKIKVSMEEHDAGSWLKYIIPKGLFSKTLKASEIYIARKKTDVESIKNRSKFNE